MAEALSGVGLPKVLYCFRTETDSRTMAQKDTVIMPTGESFSAMWTYFLYHKTLITILVMHFVKCYKGRYIFLD